MTDKTAPTNLKRYLPHVVIATFAVLGFPLLILSALQAFGPALSPLSGTGLGIALSIGVASVASAAWTRHKGSKDVVFGDLMVWGWLHRLRLERRFAEVTALLGADAAGRPRSGVALKPKRQAKILKQLASALEARDPYTHGHTRRVTRYSYMTAKKMGLPKDEVKKVRVAAAVHDVGKLNIPNEIVHKPGKLTDAEYALIKEHAPRGAEMVSRIGDAEITAMVRHHHERLDGNGYPDGLAGAQIPLGARIIAVADTFDAVTSTRSYRAGCTHKEAIEILKKEAGSQLDARAVNAFTGYYSGRRAVAFWATLTAAPQRLLEALSKFSNAGAAAVVQAAVVSAAVAVGAFGGPLNFHRDSDAVAATSEANVNQVTAIPNYQNALGRKQRRGNNSPESSKPGRFEHDVAQPDIAGPGWADLPGPGTSSPGEHGPDSRDSGGDPSAGGSDRSKGGSGRPGKVPGSKKVPTTIAPAPAVPAAGATGPAVPATDAPSSGPPSDAKGCGQSHDGPDCKRKLGK